MDILSWIKKTGFQVENDNLNQILDELVEFKINTSKIQTQIIKHKNELKKLNEQLELNKDQVREKNREAMSFFKILPIISIGYDSRSSTYICIIKHENSIKSFYLGNRDKIIKMIQNYYPQNLAEESDKYIKQQVKMIVSTVIYELLIAKSTNILSKNVKLNFQTIIEKYYATGLWDYWRST